MKLGKSIKAIRNNKKFTQAELAAKAGISRSYLADVEANRYNPSLETLNKIADALEVHIGDLIIEDTDQFIINNIEEEARKTGIQDLNDPEILYRLRPEAQEKISLKLIKYIMDNIRHETPNSNVNISSIRKLEKVRMVPKVGKVPAGMPLLAEENIEGYMPIDTFFLDENKKYYLLEVKGDSMNLEFQEGTWVLVEKTESLESGQLGVVLIDGYEATVKKSSAKSRYDNSNSYVYEPCTPTSDV